MDLSFLAAGTGRQTMPLKITGVCSESLVTFQKLILYMLSDGSDGLHVGGGAGLAKLLSSANAGDETRLQQLVSISLAEAADALRSSQQGQNLTPATTFNSASLSGFGLSGDSITMSITVNTMASSYTGTVSTTISNAAQAAD